MKKKKKKKHGVKKKVKKDEKQFRGAWNIRKKETHTSLLILHGNKGRGEGTGMKSDISFLSFLPLLPFSTMHVQRTGARVIVQRNPGQQTHQKRSLWV